jgi:hypothetical protein
VEYIYAFVEKNGEKAVVVIRTEDIEAGLKALKDGGITILSEEEIKSI